MGIPQILLPYKHGTTSSHQVLNAKYLEERGFGFTVNSFEEMLTNIKNISEGIKNKEFNLENIPIGNLTISRKLYEQTN